MCNLSSDVNNTTKKILQGQNTRAEIGKCNTTEYGLKSYYAKLTIVKCAKVHKSTED